MSVASVFALSGGWLALKATQINEDLQDARELLPKFTNEINLQDEANAASTLDQITTHTSSARRASSVPIWKFASEIPVLGSNLAAVREVTIAADEVATKAARPLLKVVGVLNWDQVSPTDGKFSLEPIEESSQTIVSAATTIELTHQRLQDIDKSFLVPPVSEALSDAIATLGSVRSGMSTAADFSRVLPSMMGTNEPREYLVLVQNNAEIRASGGLPGALAVIRVEDGQLTLVAQTTGSAMGKFDPPVDVDVTQTNIYSSRLGAYIGDVNLTPDFPTTAKAAKAMWERKFGGSIDGVVAVDPVVLAHLLDASGPLPLSNAGLPAGLPVELTSKNVVPTLLSDVYQAFSTNAEQDDYFAAASREVFQALATGSVSGPALLASLTRSYEENRLRLWSAHRQDQEILEDIPLGGAISGPSTGGASFGVYFNDGTGAKMDYFVRRKVQLKQVCSSDGYSQYKVMITLTNTAAPDAAAILPAAVTGGGKFGTPAGSVQTNIVAYGPALSHVDTTTQDGAKVSFGSHVHSGRPVGIHTVRLAPGETASVEMTFVKVVQDAAPVLVVTPTVEDVNDVTLPTLMASCAE